MSSSRNDSEGAAPQGRRAPHPGKGHRGRLRDRLVRAGVDALEPHEVLELLLGVAIRGRDTKGLAKDLLRRFGGFARVLDASREDLLAVPKVGTAVANAILATRAAAVAYLADRSDGRSALSTPALVADYCRMRLAGEPREVVAAILLDSKNRVEKTVILHEGTVDRSTVFPREVAACALAARATGVILAHNHPSGSPEPSRDDQAVTRELKQALGAIGVRMLDHLIVGREGYYSFQEAGLI